MGVECFRLFLYIYATDLGRSVKFSVTNLLKIVKYIFHRFKESPLSCQGKRGEGGKF